MKIYVGHSTSFNYKEELYAPLRNSALNTAHEIILPHETSSEQFSTKALFESGCDAMIAEVSYPSTGLGIELGWASTYDVPIVFIHKEGAKISSALGVLSENYLEYNSASEMTTLIEDYLKTHNLH